MPIQNRFVTSIYTDQLSRERTFARWNRELLEQAYLVRDTDDEGQEWSRTHYLHGYTSYGSITDLHRRFPHFEDLERRLRPHARKFARALDFDLGEGTLTMSTCWVNIMPTNTAHALHLHPLSVLSGTYYVTVPRHSSPIKFEDPRLSFMMAAPPKTTNAHPRNETFVTLKPEVGQVALWESWLRHEVPPNTGEADRVSVSFNYEWR